MVKVRISRKAVLSLLISVILMAVFTVLAFTGLFDLVDRRFYSPSVAGRLGRETDLDALAVGDLFESLRQTFAASLAQEAVRRSFLPAQSNQDIIERTAAYGGMLESVRGLQSVRFVDAGGLRIHYSTESSDILEQGSESLAYRSYDTADGYIPYVQVEVPDLGEFLITMDGDTDRIVFSFPFYDSYDTYRGTALFTLSAGAVTGWLAGEGRIPIGEDISVLSSPKGIVSGLPRYGREAILPEIASAWKDGNLSFSMIASNTSDTALVLISAKTSQGIFVGRVADESLFAVPLAMKAILFLSCFLTLFLVFFLLFSLRQDPVLVIQTRMKRLQIRLIEEYFDRKSDFDWERWIRELKLRREDVRSELKRGISLKNGSENAKNIDSLIDKSWEDLLALIRSSGGQSVTITEEKLQSMISQALAALAVRSVKEDSAPGPDLVEEAVTVEESAEDDAEDIEELEDLDEPLDLEEAEELEEAGEAEELEVLEEAGPAEEETSDPLKKSLTEVASEIEFSPVSPPEGVEEPGGNIIENLEVVSPLETIQSKFPPEPVIEEQDGVSYISEEALNPAPEDEQNLDPGMKGLIDEVVNKIPEGTKKR